jgi:hypothetical protein
MPGEALLALWQNAGFEQVKLAGYTGMKSSPYTEGALLSAAKPGLGRFRERAEPVVESLKPVSPPQPGGS